MKQSTTPPKTQHAPSPALSPKGSPQHGQTEAAPGRAQIREEMASTRSPRESKRPIERTAKPGKGKADT